MAYIIATRCAERRALKEIGYSFSGYEYVFRLATDGMRERYEDDILPAV